MGIMDKVKATSQKVGEKAKGAVEAGQEKLDETKTKKHIGELKEELGGIIYAQRTGTAAAGAETEIERIVGEIKTAEEHLGELAAS